MNVKKMLLYVGLAILALFLLIQLVPVSRTNPPVTSEPAWDSPETRALAKQACFDCHSNETEWPFYAYVAPVSWLVAHDTNEGRAEFNFSEWDKRRQRPGEMAEAINSGWMPPASFLALHPDARLTDAEKQQLIDGFNASLKR